MLEGLIAPVAAWIVGVVSAAGYAGVAGLMAIESACVPLPSEVIMPFAGYLASTGRFSLWAAATAGAIGCNLGSTLAYVVGAKGGRRAVERWVRYVLLDPGDLDRADRFFRRYGGPAVMLTRMLPVVRTFIALPAGIARMPMIPFQVYTFAGSWPWCYALAYVGDALGARWQTDPALRNFMHRFDVVVVALPLLAAGLALSGCAGTDPAPLPTAAALAPDVGALVRTRPGAPPIAVDAPLSPGEVALLALQNSPDLRATRARHGVSQAQVVQAGLLPDPVLAGSYGFLFAGPAFTDAIGATITADITALILRPAKRRAAQAAARQVDADIVWQEWQTASRAETLTVDIVEQTRGLALIDQTLALLRRRSAITGRALAQGDTTVQAIAPFAVELAALETTSYAAQLALQQNWQALAALLGLLPSVRPMLSDRLGVPVIGRQEADALIASLPRRRPDLVALQYGYQSQEETLRGAILGQFPALTVGPNYGSDTARVQTIGPSLSVTLPLFNGNRGQIAIDRATREQLHEEYVARLAAAVGGARALLANLDLLERQLDEAQSGVGAARALAAGAETGLAAGLLDELAYVELISARLGKERQVIGLEQQVLDTRIALATLLAAGLPPMRIEAGS